MTALTSSEQVFIKRQADAKAAAEKIKKNGGEVNFKFRKFKMPSSPPGISMLGARDNLLGAGWSEQRTDPFKFTPKKKKRSKRSQKEANHVETED